MSAPTRPPSATATTGADAIVEALARAGVEVAFGLPGVHNLALWKALHGSPVRLVGVRHEQTAAYAADGYARACGRVGVALVTTGPGAANTLAAVGEANASGSPVVVVATDIPSTLRRPGMVGGVLHECSDQVAMFAPVTKAQFTVTSPADAGGTITAALHAATSGAPGPVLVEVPTDHLAGPAPGDPPDAEHGSAARPDSLDSDAAALLHASTRPVIWAGGGAIDAGPQLAALAERLGAPVVTTYGARGVLPPGHSLHVGVPHTPAAGRLWDDADLVIAVGTDLDGVDTQNWRQPQPPKLLAVNVDAEDATKNYAADAVVAMDSAEGCAALLAATPSTARAPWADVDAVRSQTRANLDRDAHAFLDTFAAALPTDALVVVDMCIPGYWLAAFHPVPAPRRLQVPLGWGTLGYGFPAAIGAALAHDGPTVSVNGDGGFLFACGDLATVAQERPRLTIVIVDDGGYGMLRFDQRAHHDAPYGVDLTRPDFAALATSFGLNAETVDGIGAKFGEALARHVADPEPSVLVARAQALTPPPNTSPQWYRTGPPAWA